MKILLFGGSGQLGHDIQRQGYDLNFEVISPVISEVNISEAQQVSYLCAQIKPNLIINSAAYTAVDLAEQERDLCFKINCDGARNVASAAKDLGCRLIHISTDYVFDGMGSRPLTEEDATAPLNVYGASKLAGEREILSIYPEKSLIVRTASLYGQRGVNFVRTMLDLFRTRDTVNVVNNQFMSPTWTGWLAESLLDLGRMEVSGVLHATCGGQASWFEFAKEILELSKPAIENASKLTLAPVSAVDFVRPAKRPAYSVLDCSRLSRILGRAPINWKDGLRFHLKELGLLN